MSRSMLPVAALCSALLLSPGAAAAQQPTQPTQPRQQTTKPKMQGDMSAKCQAMMAEHQKMMEEIKATDQRLDELVSRMNSATGQAKVDATAEAVAQIVTQRKADREAMMQMQHKMMTHMGEHMQAGAKSMAMCPMMKDMGSMKH